MNKEGNEEGKEGEERGAWSIRGTEEIEEGEIEEQ